MLAICMLILGHEHQKQTHEHNNVTHTVPLSQIRQALRIVTDIAQNLLDDVLKKARSATNRLGACHLKTSGKARHKKKKKPIEQHSQHNRCCAGAEQQFQQSMCSAKLSAPSRHRTAATIVCGRVASLAGQCLPYPFRRHGVPPPAHPPPRRPRRVHERT